MFDEELKKLLEEQGKAFESFKDRHDKALADERKARDQLEMRLNRMGLAGTLPDAGAHSLNEERKAIASFVRTGNDLELKAHSVSSDPDGGYLVFPQIASAIRTKVRDVSVMARLARRVSIGKHDAFEEPFDQTDIGATWVGEKESRPETASATLGVLRVQLHEIYALQVVTQKLLDTTDLDLGEWVVGRIGDKFARSEGTAYVSGDGVNMPRGLLTYPTAATPDSTRPVGTFQHIASGAAGAFAASNPQDRLVDLIYSLRTPYRQNARFVMNMATAGAVRKMKDADGRFLWSDGLGAGQPARLLGFPVELDEAFPDIAANSLSIAFGDFEQAYTVVEQAGIKMLRDPYSSKPNVQFYGYRRVGGGAAETEAVKFLKFSTT